MKSNVNLIAWTAAALLTVSAGNGAVPGDQARERNYGDLQSSNPFRLRPPAPPPQPDPGPPVMPPPKIELYLTGLTTLTDQPRAFIMTKNAKGEKQYYSFAQGEGEDGLELLDIDLEKKRVKLNNSGDETLLSFDTHGIKPPATPAPAAPAVRGAPGAPNSPGGAGSPNPLTANAGAANPRGGVRTLPRPHTNVPQRQVRTTANMDPRMAARYGFGDAGAGGGGEFDTGQGGNDQRGANQAEDRPQYSAEEQVVLMGLQRAANPDIPYPPIPGLPETTLNAPPDFSGAPNIPQGDPGQFAPVFPPAPVPQQQQQQQRRFR